MTTSQTPGAERPGGALLAAGTAVPIPHPGGDGHGLAADLHGGGSAARPHTPAGPTAPDPGPAGQTASGQVSGEGVWPLAPPRHPPCTCSHIYGGHDITKNGVRTKCLHISGPRGTPCGCRRYEPATELPGVDRG